MKLWGGRFLESLDDAAARLNASIEFDWRMVDEDIQGSAAWAGALVKAGVLTSEEGERIRAGLVQVRDEVMAGSFHPTLSDEDVHTAVERRLTEIVGPLGGKLHTGRSRNDQVATDFRLWVMQTAAELDERIKEAQAALVARAQADIGIVMPGYTHVQRAQPVLLSHWWLAHFWPLQRDRERLSQARRRAAVLPLGSGALAGAPFAVDRDQLAAELGFASVSPNSIDAVSDRDFAAEFLFFGSLLAVHLSRLSEGLILFSSAEFGFVEISDTYATGSSLMPQKKNPDTLELTRGKTGAVIGRLMGLLTTLKGLPSAYDKDLQEDKLPVFETADTLNLLLRVMAGLLGSLKIRPQRIQAALDPAMLATELADYLVARGVPFRQAHGLVGQVVRRAQETGAAISELSLAELQAISPVFEADAAAVFDFLASAARRSLPGGTAPQAVQAQLEQAVLRLEADVLHLE